jgi:hypothetical protein
MLESFREKLRFSKTLDFCSNSPFTSHSGQITVVVRPLSGKLRAARVLQSALHTWRWNFSVSDYSFREIVDFPKAIRKLSSTRKVHFSGFCWETCARIEQIISTFPDSVRPALQRRGGDFCAAQKNAQKCRKFRKFFWGFTSTWVESNIFRNNLHLQFVFCAFSLALNTNSSGTAYDKQMRSCYYTTFLSYVMLLWRWPRAGLFQTTRI